MQSIKKIFYKDHAVRRRLRRRRRRSRPPYRIHITYENPLKNLNEICCKMKVCSLFHRNKTNNICKTDATHFLQNDITQKFIIEHLIGCCKTDATHLLRKPYYRIHITQKWIIELGWYGISICHWIHIMLLISHRVVTINAANVLHSNEIVGFYYKICYLILYMIIWYQKIIESSWTVLILTKITQIISVRLRW